MTDAQKLVIEEAKTWLNTPYHWNTRIKGVGVDCGQLLIGIFENTGVLEMGECDPGIYSNERHLHRTEEFYLSWIEKYCRLITDEPQPGDIVMFRYGKCNSHSALVVEWPLLIHSYVRLGVIFSEADDALFKYDNGDSRVTGIYRFRGW